MDHLKQHAHKAVPDIPGRAETENDIGPMMSISFQLLKFSKKLLILSLKSYQFIKLTRYTFCPDYFGLLSQIRSFLDKRQAQHTVQGSESDIVRFIQPEWRFSQVT
ncbi:hypothetical protein [Acetobacter sp.]|jgi:hypothetical protein|uniref:hypothetical protein n=1 Tax=Acetobacter sp. TaxID=440 RepID=UPI0025B95CD0|nr:hypothetical protein [Acetobacter sp.]MCH4092324.1 hypothetical protein [Acetobacter sp.]